MEEGSQGFETARADELQHLKRVSRIKHMILAGYFRPWAIILGSKSGELVYVDCFQAQGCMRWTASQLKALRYRSAKS